MTLDSKYVDIYIKGFEDGVKFSTDIFDTVVAKQLKDLIDLYNEVK